MHCIVACCPILLLFYCRLRVRLDFLNKQTNGDRDGIAFFKRARSKLKP